MPEAILKLFTLNTLEYLHKGGRIGKVSSLLGSILNIKPVIQVNHDGVYIPVCKGEPRIRHWNKSCSISASRLKAEK